jgi:predicted Zn-ribbon and HTH transcriptional regulator
MNVDVTLTCAELRDLLGDHVAGELVTEKKESFELHIKQCEDCGFYVESYTHTVKVVKKLPKCSLPAGTEAKLRAALKEHLEAASG